MSRHKNMRSLNMILVIKLKYLTNILLWTWKAIGKQLK